MSTLKQFLQTTYNRGVFWWLNYYWNHLLEVIYSKPIVSSNKDYVGIRISKSVIPEGWTKENTFKYLENEYKGRIMKRYKD